MGSMGRGGRGGSSFNELMGIDDPRWSSCSLMFAGADAGGRIRGGLSERGSRRASGSLRTVDGTSACGERAASTSRTLATDMPRHALTSCA